MLRALLISSNIAGPENYYISRKPVHYTVCRITKAFDLGLTPWQACRHTHGVYTQLPAHAEAIRTNSEGDVISWRTTQYGGTLFAAMLDPIVKHGVQQITHLDNYVVKLTEWLSGIKPTPERMTIDPAL